MPKTYAVAILASFTAACAAPPASAGEWRLDPRRCPDLREDVRDSRVDRSRRDVREDRRDRRFVNCPASAFVWVPARTARFAAVPARPVYSRIFIDTRGRYFGVRNNRNIRITLVR